MTNILNVGETFLQHILENLSQQDEPGDLPEQIFFSYASASPIILFLHFCHIDRTYKYNIVYGKEFPVL